MFKYIEDEWLRSALLPLSANQRMAMHWLSDYFQKYGDAVPNRDEIRMSLSTKSQAWDSYQSM